jgi:hypothetical protein
MKGNKNPEKNAGGRAIVLIMDNAPYHRRIKDTVPRAKGKKLQKLQIKCFINLKN